MAGEICMWDELRHDKNTQNELKNHQTKEQIVVSLCDKDFNEIAQPVTYVKDHAGGTDEYIRTDIVYKAMEEYKNQSLTIKTN